MAVAAEPIPPHRMLCLLNLRLQLQDLQQKHMGVLALLIHRRQRYERQRRRWWVRPWIERRMLFGQYHTLMMELERECQGTRTIERMVVRALSLDVSPIACSCKKSYDKVITRAILSHPRTTLACSRAPATC